MVSKPGQLGPAVCYPPGASTCGFLLTCQGMIASYAPIYDHELTRITSFIVACDWDALFVSLKGSTFALSLFIVYLHLLTLDILFWFPNCALLGLDNHPTYPLSYPHKCMQKHEANSRYSTGSNTFSFLSDLDSFKGNHLRSSLRFLLSLFKDFFEAFQFLDYQTPLSPRLRYHTKELVHCFFAI